MLDIVVMCASHIDKPNKILLLMTQIQSIMNQSLSVPMYVSISGNIAIPIHDYPIKLYTHDHQLSQFEHYDFLCSQLDPNTLTSTFIVFCDDDDYSHRDRCIFYAKSSDFGQYCMLACDGVLLLNDMKSVNGYEYFMFAVRANILKQYCDIMTQHNCLKSSVCDVLFGSALAHSSKLTWRSVKPLSWIYAYNNQDKDREHEIIEYKKLLENKELISQIERLFKIEKWIPGETSIYGDAFKPVAPKR